MSYVDMNAEELWMQSKRAFEDVQDVKSGLSMVAQDAASVDREVRVGTPNLRRAQRTLADLLEVFEEELEPSRDPYAPPPGPR